MMNTMSLKLALGMMFAFTTAGPLPASYSAASDPSPAQIYLVAARNLAQARRMTQDVLERHPDSAVAHWVAAVLDVRAARFFVASQELARAEELAPGLPFVGPALVADLQRQLEKTSGATIRGVAHVASASADTR